MSRRPPSGAPSSPLHRLRPPTHGAARRLLAAVPAWLLASVLLTGADSPPARAATTPPPQTTTPASTAPTTPSTPTPTPPTPSDDTTPTVPAGWSTPEGPEDVGARGAVLYDPEGDVVLWGRDATTPRRMASTTKIMTTLLAVEAGAVDETVTVSARAAALGRVPGGASLGLREGQRLPMRDLLSGLMLRSGNDAAVAVAEHVAGSEAAFVERMNARAAELGLTDTNFVNASGLTDDPAHHASPYDLARLADVALAEPEIEAWAAAAELDNPTFGTIGNRNELLGRYPGADGVKTGYTALAGRCLVASAERGDRSLITVVLGSEDHFADSTAVLDHGFEEWARYAVAPGPWSSFRTSAGTVPVTAEDDVAVTAPADAPVAARVTWAPVAGAGLRSGQRLGTLRLFVDGTEVASTRLSAAAATSVPDSAGVGDGLEDALRALVRLRDPTPAVSS